jgi:hypothetical protein
MSMNYRLFLFGATTTEPFAIGVSSFPLVVGDLINRNSSFYRIKERRMKHEDQKVETGRDYSGYLSISHADLYVVREG